jgi:C4-dicarboxylate-specific signal transduction histidine kinase
MQDVNMDEVVREVFEFMAPQASAVGASLERTTGTQAMIVKGDPVQLQQVVLNLVLNALDSVSASSEGERRIVTRTQRSGDKVELSIADSGPGVPDEHLNAIFDPFVTTKGGGMGMGLAIARSIVQAHGGRIWVGNESGGGAVFRFTLPLAMAGELSQ